MNLKAIVEGLIFLSGDEGLTNLQLIDTLGINNEQLDEVINELMNDYLDDNRGFELVYYGNNYKFVTKEFVYESAEKLFSSTKIATLSPAALETLAIIAYKQPITRIEIEEIRGTNSDNMVRKLLARSLIKECGRSDAPGRPFLYEVTDNFMDTFKLESLKELPELKDFNEEEENFMEIDFSKEKSEVN